MLARAGLIHASHSEASEGWNAFLKTPCALLLATLFSWEGFGMGMGRGGVEGDCVRKEKKR